MLIDPKVKFEIVKHNKKYPENFFRTILNPIHKIPK